MTTPTLNSTLGANAFYALLAVVDRPLHGYGIRDQIAYDSKGQLVPATGTVYITLKRLTSQGPVECIEPGGARTDTTCRYPYHCQGSHTSGSRNHPS